MAHAVLGAVVAEINGNSALAGAAGAAGGELAAQVLADKLYGKKPSELTEQERQNVSTLGTIVGGLAGGLAGKGSGDVVAGGEAGKNAIENNLLGGNEDTQAAFAREHGKNIASCSTDPSSASCQKGLATQDALAIAIPAGLGGGILAAATPEIAAAAKAAIQACAGNVVLCLNNAGITMSEAIVPGGVGAGGAIGIGKTAVEAAAAKTEAAAANAIKNGGKTPTNPLTPNSFVTDVTKHNTQIGTLNAKKTGIAGAHKQDAFLESVEVTGAKINLKTTDKSYPGLIEYQYQLPSKAGNGPNAGKVIGYKKTESKTTYDPKILPDAKVADMSNKAAKQSESYFLSNPAHREYSVKVDGYWFQVTRDAKTGKVSNAFITMPPRNTK